MAIKQKWQCHKTVEAFKITETEIRPTIDKGKVVILIGPYGQGEVVDEGWVTKHLPEGSLHRISLEGGYFVRYPDGYTSWSPAEAFEAGYTELP